MNNQIDDKKYFLKGVQIACMSMLLLIPTQIILFIMFPPVTDVEMIFHQFQNNWVIGLIQFDFIYIINNILLILIYLYLFDLTFKKFKYGSLVAIALGLVGIASYFSSNPSFELMALSHKFIAQTPENRALYLATGETLLVGYTGTSFNVYYVLNAICLFLFSIYLLKLPEIKKSIGITGLLSAFLMSVPSSAGQIGIFFALSSLIPWTAFIFLLTFNIQSTLKSQSNI
ncbi:DUF4386 family protein [Fusibacter bizertensis]